MKKKFLILALLPFLVGCKNTKEENQFETDKNGRLYSPSWREKENLIVFHSDDPQEDNTTGEDLKISLKRIITLAREVNSQSEFMDSYYTDQINEKLSGSKFKGMLKEGEEVSVKLIFICDSSVDEMYA